MTTYTPKFQREEIRTAIQTAYGEIARDPSCAVHFNRGLPLAQMLGYDKRLIAATPSGAVAAFAGVGNPFAIDAIVPGETVLDVGSGAGFDTIIASRLTGPTGQVFGLDMTVDMLARASNNAHEAGIDNIRFVRGFAESIPLFGASVDVVISNGVINLCPNKPDVFAELFRVLKPGGRLQVADVLLEHEVPHNSVDLVHLWTDCVAGGVLVDDYVAMLRDAGFVDIEITDAYDVFNGAEVEANAIRFGARGHNIRAKKP